MGKLQDVLEHPEEIWPLIQMARTARKAKTARRHDPDLDFCYGMLNAVSRSFAIVIQELPRQLRDAICIFYLVLRALDTVEDDMAIAIKTKVPELIAFHTRLKDREWRYPCGEGHYKRLMLEYPRVTHAFLQLQPVHQAVISDIAKQMGAGMADFIEREVETVQDYDLYCHYVAGLIGLGLSQLFHASGLEHKELPDDLANHMGLFLQKTNIIRDYLEDINEQPAPRMFWPREIWGLYAKDLEDFKRPELAGKAVHCLNHLVLNVLGHAPHSLDYLSRLEDRQVFRFCAIPQVMAIGTLALCHNNHGVFTGVVKMRRGEVAKYMTSLSSLRDTRLAFAHFACVMLAKCEGEAAQDPCTPQIKARLQALLEGCAEGLGTTAQELQRSGGQLGGATAPGVLSVHSLAVLAVLLLVCLALYSFLLWAWRA